MMMKRWTDGPPATGAVRRKWALRIPHVETSGKIVRPDGDANAEFVLPRLSDMVDLKYVKAVQRKHAADRPVGYKQVRGV